MRRTGKWMTMSSGRGPSGNSGIGGQFVLLTDFDGGAGVDVSEVEVGTETGSAAAARIERRRRWNLDISLVCLSMKDAIARSITRRFCHKELRNN
jgi:hypothetical protein